MVFIKFHNLQHDLQFISCVCKIYLCVIKLHICILHKQLLGKLIMYKCIHVLQIYRVLLNSNIFMDQCAPKLNLMQPPTSKKQFKSEEMTKIPFFLCNSCKEKTKIAMLSSNREQLIWHGTCTETTLCLSAKRTSPFKPAGVSVQSTTGS
jgi:hypothetical protein